ncbi:hypothetical protein GCM10027405_17210 [Arthrobacter alkaliphilus]|uniref:DUF4439 domain-containing protein n=1 Tax=Arthrobacter alkaliphilus TaxID=369936 RepID=UPI001F40F57F|nr:DUF4439 domain-containing protein [Arthrobacter alkaliphilus]
MRTLLLAFLAVLVLGVGAVLVPREAGRPQVVPSFSETARSDALSSTETLLRSAALLESTDTVTLLTTQARALLRPSGPSASATPPASPGPGATQDRPTRGGFVSALSSSASRRLADAAKADGGMARLLAAVGTAQLLESSRLAAAWGLPAPEVPPAAGTATAPPPSCPPSPGTAAPTSGAAATKADLPGALAAVVSSEQEAIYAYQVALTKLDAKVSATAATWLARHQELLRAAEGQGRLHCIATPPREAGYRLPATFAAKPGLALGSLESSSLTAYADLVALSDGETRQWAIEGLVDAAKRSQAWGSPVGPFAGLSIDDAALPPLPTGTPAP